jgi:hypothetical protein
MMIYFSLIPLLASLCKTTHVCTVPSQQICPKCTVMRERELWSLTRVSSQQICPKCTVMRERELWSLTRVRHVPGGATASSTAVRVDAGYSVLSDKPTNRVPAPRRPPTAGHAVRPPHHPRVTEASSSRPPRRDPAAPTQLFVVPATLMATELLHRPWDR